MVLFEWTLGKFSSTSCLRLCFAVADKRIENFFVQFQQQWRFFILQVYKKIIADFKKSLYI